MCLKRNEIDGEFSNSEHGSAVLNEDGSRLLFGSGREENPKRENVGHSKDDNAWHGMSDDFDPQYVLEDPDIHTVRDTVDEVTNFHDECDDDTDYVVLEEIPRFSLRKDLSEDDVPDESDEPLLKELTLTSW